MSVTRGFFDPCNCVSTCGDTDDEYGVCKRLPPEPKPPLVEVVLVHRDDARRRARPDFDPRVDYPERYGDGPY